VDIKKVVKLKKRTQKREQTNHASKLNPAGIICLLLFSLSLDNKYFPSWDLEHGEFCLEKPDLIKIKTFTYFKKYGQIQVQ